MLIQKSHSPLGEYPDSIHRARMANWKIKTDEVRVGIVGLFASGKTVLLTSLINHLADHDPERFRLALPGQPPVLLRKFRVAPVETGWSAFDYARNRDALVHGHWPAKTRDRSQFACAFERSDWRLSEVLLRLYDLPGERIVDAIMHKVDYAGWSDHILGLWNTDSHYRTAAAEYFTLLSANPKLDVLVPAYKRALARLILSYKPYISPSTFLLDVHGQLAKSADVDTLAATRYAGLDAASEFVPLPASVRGQVPDLVQELAQRYETYKTAVVLPAVAALKACHALIVLIDVPMLLNGGVGMHDDCRQMLVDLLATLEPGESTLGTLTRGLAYALLPHEWRPGWVRKIAFVAPKADLVHPDDRDKMESLLRRLAERPAADRDGLRTAFINVCATVSTRPLPGQERTLLGRPMRGPDGRKIAPGDEQKFVVSALPADWPRHWNANEFVFPEVWPSVPARKNCAPDHINLDRLLAFVLE